MVWLISYSTTGLTVVIQDLDLLQNKRNVTFYNVIVRRLFPSKNDCRKFDSKTLVMGAGVLMWNRLGGVGFPVSLCSQ